MMAMKGECFIYGKNRHGRLTIITTQEVFERVIGGYGGNFLRSALWINDKGYLNPKNTSELTKEEDASVILNLLRKWYKRYLPEDAIKEAEAYD